MYLTIDTETGGIGQQYSLLTAYFGVFNKDFEQIDELELWLKPDDGIYRVCGEALEVNGIDLIALEARAISYKEARGVLYNFISKNAQLAGTQLSVVGQQVRGDIESIVTNLMSRKTLDQFVSYRVLDTATIARFLQIQGKLPADLNCSLKSMIEYFDISLEGSQHEAKYDALATFKVFTKLLSI